MDTHGSFTRPLPPQRLSQPPNSPFAAATNAPSFSTAPTHSPQHAPSPFQNPPPPQARFQQQPPFFHGTSSGNGQRGAFPPGGVGPGGGVVQPTNMQLHTRAQQPPASPYSTAPYSPALPSPATSASQNYSQFPKTASPSTSNGNGHASWYGSGPNPLHPQPSPTHAQHQHQHPMAAPPVTAPQGPRSVPQSPVSSGAQARDKERVTLLLEINTELLQEICSLQGQGKSGHIGPMPPPKDDGKEEVKAASKEYIDCMRRLQANLSYLATTAERTHKPAQQVPPGPAIMSVPPTPPGLAELYTKLQSLFPGWKGQQQQQKASPGPQRPNPQQQQVHAMAQQQ